MAIDIEISLHDAQLEVWQDATRFRVLAAGRRWGKTWMGSALCVDTALRGGRAWWIAPSYPMANVGWRGLNEVREQLAPHIDIERRMVDRALLFPGGGEVWVKSADKPDSLRGEGLNFAVLDECAFMKEAAWTEALRPALSDRQGRALFISTPKGRNWYWRLWTLGNGGGDPEFRSWRYPTSANPFIPQSEIDAAQRSLPSRIFQQEYLAEFIDDTGGVFRGVMGAATATAQGGAVEGHAYIFGVDWGKLNDFTVIAVLDATTSELVALDRYNRIDYRVQVARLEALCERFAPTDIIAERNSMGEPLVEQLQYRGLPVTPFLTTARSKMDAVDALALAFERRALTILPDPTLVAELQAYEGTRMAHGAMRYAAPEGMHDDTVMALMMAWSGMSVGPAVYEL